MKNNKLITITLLIIGVLFIAVPALANGEPAELETSMPGRTEEAGTYFEITDSEYLNVSLQSTEEITILLESVPKTISLHIEASTSINSTILTIEELEPNTTYSKFEDSYKNKAVFVSNENGSYTWTQDLTQSHHIWFQLGENGTVFLPDDCSTYGTWNATTSTCVLNQDLTESIEITENNITLDCNGHNIISTGSGYGTYLPTKEGVVIKKCVVINFSYGIYLHRSPVNTLTDNTVSNNSYGIYLYGYGSRNNTLTANTTWDNYYGIYLYASSNNTLTANTTFNSSFGILLYNRSSNNTLTANTALDNSYGISLYGLTSNNILTENTVSNNGRGIYICCYGSNNNKIYHNNFVDNYSQTYIIITTANIFDDGYLSGGNYWSDYTDVDLYSGPNQDQLGPDGIGDIPYTFPGGQDRYPFMEKDGWENQLPTLLGLGQFKSDATTSIPEAEITTEPTVVFQSTLSDLDNDRTKLQIELKEYEQEFNEQDLIESDFVDSGQTAQITRFGLISQSYHWRVRAIDEKGAVSDWQEFGETENIDFEVKLVPLYTQIISDYPSRFETEQWAVQNYAYATSNKPYPSCGWQIKDCGCVITSEVMILRFHDITTDTDNNDVNPGTYNEWFTNNNGYWQNGDINWEKIAEYSKNPDTGLGLRYDGPIGYKDNTALDLYVDSLLYPVILYETVLVQGKYSPHFIVADGKLADTYTVKDPAWYNTKYLSQSAGSYAQNYNNNFYGLRLFSPGIVAANPLIYIHLCSPAELLITDPLGRKLGKDPITNIEYNEIPNGSYYSEGISNPFAETPTQTKESKNVWIPNPIDGKYDIKVIGTDPGSYTLGFSVYDQTGQSKDVTIESDTTVDNIQEFDLNYSIETIKETELYRIVAIDIKPGSEPNSINLKSKGVTQVAVLTDAFFNAKNIAIDTVGFAGANPLRGNLEDVDNDNDLDLILHFKTQSLQLDPSDTETVLTGQLNNSTLIKGIDSVRIISHKKLSLAGFLFYLWDFILNIIKF